MQVLMYITCMRVYGWKKIICSGAGAVQGGKLWKVCGRLWYNCGRILTIMMINIHINILDRNFQSVRNYIDVFAEHAFVNEINLLTYVLPSTNARTSCLDHIWHNLKIPRKSFIIHPNLSDHYATCLVFNKKIHSKLEPIKFRNYSSECITWCTASGLLLNKDLINLVSNGVV